MASHKLYLRYLVLRLVQDRAWLKQNVNGNHHWGYGATVARLTPDQKVGEFESLCPHFVYLAPEPPSGALLKGRSRD